MSMRSLIAVLGVVVWAAGASPSHAVQISSVTLPPSMTVQEQQLQLTGCGIREEMFMDIYVIGLYLPQADMSREAILSQDTTKAVHLHIVYDGTVPNEVPESWREPLKEMVQQDIRQTLKDIYRKFESGDKVVIRYAPSVGTVAIINGDQVLNTQGHDVMQALLKLWIGEQAISDNLRRLLLQGKCEGGDGGLF